MSQDIKTMTPKALIETVMAKNRMTERDVADKLRITLRTVADHLAFDSTGREDSLRPDLRRELERMASSWWQPELGVGGRPAAAPAPNEPVRRLLSFVSGTFAPYDKDDGFTAEDIWNAGSFAVVSVGMRTLPDGRRQRAARFFFNPPSGVSKHVFEIPLAESGSVNSFQEIKSRKDVGGGLPVAMELTHFVMAGMVAAPKLALFLLSSDL